jgi:hypothetical protein
MAAAKISRRRSWFFVSCAVVGALLLFSFASGACKDSGSRKAGKEARETFEKSKEIVKEGLEKTGEVAKEGLEKGTEAAKEGLDKSREAAKEFGKGWKEGGK